MFSSVTVKGAEKTLEALKVGATDFIPKIEGEGISESLELITRDLVPKIKALGQTTINKPAVKPHTPSTVVKHVDTMHPVKAVSVSDYLVKPNLLCIGSSTGGPDALLKIFAEVKVVPPFPVLLTQHMPPMFTTKLADSLNSITAMEVVEAKHGQPIKSGVCYLAPGDYHMTLKREHSEFFIELTQSEKVCHVRPSVDVMLESVNQSFTGKIMTIILTGMGSDGANGCEKLAKKSHPLFIQDEESSVVWGMPGAVAKRNLGAKSLSLSEIGPFLNKVFGS
jgi:two-component system chemotaxis response regulator CheB